MLNELRTFFDHSHHQLRVRGVVLQGEFDSENKASFYSFAGKSCVKFEVENLDKQEDGLSGVEKLLRELAE